MAPKVMWISAPSSRSSRISAIFIRVRGWSPVTSTLLWTRLTRAVDVFTVP
jgi:hypothetical protein